MRLMVGAGGKGAVWLCSVLQRAFMLPSFRFIVAHSAMAFPCIVTPC